MIAARAGKAPRQVIEKKFRKEIQDELTKALATALQERAGDKAREATQAT